jgi:hypothetical protein
MSLQKREKENFRQKDKMCKDVEEREQMTFGEL